MLSLNLALCDGHGEQAEIMEHVDLKTSFRRQSNSDMIIEVDTVDKIYQGLSFSFSEKPFLKPYWDLIIDVNIPPYIDLGAYTCDRLYNL